MNFLKKFSNSQGENLEQIWMIVFKNGHEYGPFSATEIIKLVANQSLADTALVCRADNPSNLMLLADVLPQLNSSVAAERRIGEPRTYCNAEITIFDERKNTLVGQCIDVSRGGLFFEIEAGQFRIGQPVYVIVNSREFAAPIAEQARIVRRFDRGGYAVQFRAPSPQTITTITQLIEGASNRRHLADDLQSAS